MNEVRRQSILSTLFMYAGVLLGALNVLVLYPNILSTEEYGFVSWLLVVGTIVSLFARLGVPQVTYKYFPFFKDNATGHNGFLGITLLIPLLGVVLGALGIWTFQDFILDRYAGSKSLDIIQQYYWLLIPLFLFDVYFNVLNSYSTSLMKAAIPAFFRDFFVRLCIVILLLLHWKDFISFETFLWGYTLTYGLQCIGLLIYLGKIGQLKLNWNLSKFKSLWSEIWRYALFTIFSSGGFYLVSYIDSLMVSSLDESGLGGMAIFRVFAYIGIFIMIPARALFNVALPVVANAWKENDLAKIDSIYKKTAITQLIIGLGLFVLVWANIDNFIEFLQYNKGDNEYAAGKYVALFIGLAKLVDGATGINGGIIVTSKYYRFDLFFILLLVIVTFVGNYLLIPRLGLNGAAIATCATAFIYNFGKYFFVKWKFGLQPFSSATWKTIVIGLALFGLNYLLPVWENHFILDALYRSAILGGLYAALILYFDLSPDITALFKKVVRRFGF